MAEGLKGFYQNVSGDRIVDPPSPGAPNGSGKASGANAAQQTIEAGRQYDELLKSFKALNVLLQEAQTGSNAAFGKILEQFGSEPVPIEVTITEPLRNSRGEEPENFGMKVVGSQQEWDAIRRDFRTASQYFPGIELKSMTTHTRGKRLAVVMGVTAREFNAVIAAERRKERLLAGMKTMDDEKEKGRKGMGVDKMTRMQAGDDRPPMTETPAQEKTQKGKTLAGVS